MEQLTAAGAVARDWALQANDNESSAATDRIANKSN
jgi:hypothetical protein